MELCRCLAGKPRHYGVALIAMVLAVPISAQAQEKVAFTFAAGALGSNDPAPGEHFVEPAYVFSVQGVIKRYFIVEGELGYWSHAQITEHGPHDISGPNGRIGSVTGTTIVDSGKLFNFGANFLVRSTGRVRVFGGVGAGGSMENSEYSQQSFGCSPSLDPRTCTRFVNARMRGPVPVLRALGGIEVPLNSRVGIFASARTETTAWEDRSRWTSAFAGVRFAF